MLALARLASEDTPELWVSCWALTEQIEAAMRTGHTSRRQLRDVLFQSDYETASG